MPLDIPAVGVAGQTIKYARGAWDFNRDGGAQGTIPLPSQQVPSPLLILGYAFIPVGGLSSLGAPTITVNVGNVPIVTFVASLVGASNWGWFPDTPFLLFDNSFPITITIAVADLTGGSAYVYVFYV
jgi:hypothetical protein